MKLLLPLVEGLGALILLGALWEPPAGPSRTYFSVNESLLCQATSSEEYAGFFLGMHNLVEAEYASLSDKASSSTKARPERGLRAFVYAYSKGEGCAAELQQRYLGVD